MDTKVVDLVDRLLDTIRFEITRMHEMGEDTSTLESQLRDFRKEQRELPDWIMSNDEPAIKVFLNRLLQFSRLVHNYYLDVKSGKHIMAAVHNEAEGLISAEEKETANQVATTIDLMSNEDMLLTDDLNGNAERDNTEDENKAQVMDVRTSVDADVKDVEELIDHEKQFVETMKRKGEDTLDLEFTINQQESLLVSLKEALMDGDYGRAEELKSQIKELGRRFS